ncbi:hypothetical protein BGX28_009515 [Mortierella sp. GBA30]|nr:hypothetical protein BGX28_009515 [Mortierella sp. GBA30]
MDETYKKWCFSEKLDDFASSSTLDVTKQLKLSKLGAPYTGGQPEQFLLMTSVGITTSGMMIAPTSNILPSSYSYQAQQHEWVPNLITKRIATWNYLMRVFRGGMVLYNTALLSEHEMRQIWPDDKMHRRSLQFFSLGTSLATILEIPSTADYMKALNSVTQEYESFAGTESRTKSIFFKAGRSQEEAGEYSFLEVKSLPFNLDYTITAATLCDMISEVYEKLKAQQLQEQIWTISTIESFHKVDTRFKKILATVLKEIETVARDVMVQELNWIDPLASTTTSYSQDYEWDL